MAFILLLLAAALFAATLVSLWRAGGTDAAPGQLRGCANHSGRPAGPEKNKPARDEKKRPVPQMVTIALVFPATEATEPPYPPDGRLRDRFYPRF